MIEAAYQAAVLEQRLREERRMDPLREEVEQHETFKRWESDLFGPAVLVAFCAAGVFLVLVVALAVWLVTGAPQS